MNHHAAQLKLGKRGGGRGEQHMITSVSVPAMTRGGLHRWIAQAIWPALMLDAEKQSTA